MLFEREPIFSYYIIFECEILQCDIRPDESGLATYISRKTTPIENPESALIYWLDYRWRAWRTGCRLQNKNRGVYILEPSNNQNQKEVAEIFINGRKIYQDLWTRKLIARYLSTAERLSNLRGETPMEIKEQVTIRHPEGMTETVELSTEQATRIYCDNREVILQMWLSKEKVEG